MNITTKTVHEVSYSDLEELIKQTYGQEFSVPADQEIGNDSSINYDNMTKGNDYDREAVMDFAATGQHEYILAEILQDLVEQDLIPEGNYLISICW